MSSSEHKLNILAILLVIREFKTDPDKLAALKQWPTPYNLKVLRSFLGFIGYNKRFVCNYSKIVKPLNALLVGHSTNKKGRRKKEATPWT